jgi:hypothetical protein
VPRGNISRPSRAPLDTEKTLKIMQEWKKYNNPGAFALDNAIHYFSI